MKILQSTIEKTLYIALAMTFIAFIIAAVTLIQSNHRLFERAQILEQQIANDQKLTEQNKQLAEQIKASTDIIDKHTDCLVTLFANSNRLNLTITDIQSCTITPSGSGGATGGTKSGQ